MRYSATNKKLYSVYTKLVSIVFAMFILSLLLACSNAGVESAKKVPITPALSGQYERAYEAVCEKASDAKLIMVRTNGDFRPTLTDSAAQDMWAYIFCSRLRVAAYLVYYENGQPVIKEYGSYTETQEEWKAISSVSSLTLDADAAYALVAEQLSKENIVATCTIYLSTLPSEKSSDESSTSSSAEALEANNWYFVFNYSEDDIILSATGAETSPFVYCVDAQTGAVSKAE